MFLIDLLSSYFHVDLIGEILYIKRVFIQSKIFSRSRHECLFITDYFSIKSVDNRIRLFEKSVDSADLL